MGGGEPHTSGGQPVNIRRSANRIAVAPPYLCGAIFDINE